MSEWTPGPWHEEHEMLLSDGGIIVCDPYGPNPQDARLIAAAPEMAELLDHAEADLALLSDPEFPDAIAHADALRERVTALLARIRGEAE